MSGNGTAKQPPATQSGPLKLLALGLGIVFAVHAWNVLGSLGHALSKTSAAGSSVDKGNHSAAMKTVMDANLFKSPQTQNFTAVSSAAASSFKLLGTFAGTGDTPSYAVIAQPGQKERSYKTGERVGGNLKVEAIYTDHVVLADGSSKVTLNIKYPQ